MPAFLKDLLRSRRFWVAIGGLAVVVLKDRLPFEVPEDRLVEISVLIGSWIVGESLRSSSAKVAE